MGETWDRQTQKLKNHAENQQAHVTDVHTDVFVTYLSLIINITFIVVGNVCVTDRIAITKTLLLKNQT